MMSTYAITTIVRGYYFYKSVWEATVLLCQQGRSEHRAQRPPPLSSHSGLGWANCLLYKYVRTIAWLASEAA